MLAAEGPFWLRAGVVAVIYFVTAKLGLSLGAVGGFATLVWPPSGIALATLLMFGYRYWPIVLASAALVNWTGGASLPVALAMGCGNSLEALTAAYLLRRGGTQLPLQRLQDILRLVVLGAGVSSLIGATIGSISLRLGGHVTAIDHSEAWLAWWIGDALGVLIVTPVIVSWRQWRPRLLALKARAVAEVLAITVLLVGTCGSVFGYFETGASSSIAGVFLLFPVVIWIALRSDLRWTATAVLVIAASAVNATAHGIGPFADEILWRGLSQLQTFLGCLAVTSLCLSAAALERVQASRLVREIDVRVAAESRIRSIIHTAYDPFVGMDDQGAVTEWNKRAETTFGWSKDEVLGMPLIEFMIPERDRAAHSVGLLGSLRSGDGSVLNRRIELTALTKDGRELVVEVTISAVTNGSTQAFGAFVRDVTREKQAARIGEIKLEVTRILAASAAVEEALPQVFETVCVGMGWDFASLWLLDEDRAKLSPSAFWHLPEAGLAAFEAVSRSMTFDIGMGLPGSVWRSGAITFIDDMDTTRTYPRYEAAIAIGLQGAVAFPIMAGEELVGVGEFLSRHPVHDEFQVREIVTDLCSRLGLYAQRKMAEETLRESEEHFKLVVEGTKDYAIFMLDQTGHIASWNRGAEQIKGYGPSEILGKHFSIFYPPEAIARALPRRELEIACSHGRYEEEGLRVRKDGTTFWASVIITALYDESRRLRGFSKVTRDITERKRSETELRDLYEDLERRVQERTKELQRQEQQLRLITDAMPIMVAHVDAHRRVLFANEAYRLWHRVDLVASPAAPIADVLGQGLYEEVRVRLSRALAGERQAFERETILPDGAKRVFAVNYIPETDEHGNVTGIVSVEADITRHKDAEEALRRAKEESDSANAAKSAFLAHMSHEIRTPLGAVLGFSELLANDDLPRDERADYLGAVQRNGELLSAVINDILDLSKVEAGKIEISLQDVPLSDLLIDATKLCNLQALDKGIRLSITSEGALPSTIRTDPMRFRQILVNIIGNAIKFTERGAVEVKVKQVTRADGSLRLAFSVSDSGIGIDPRQASRLFAPFAQADASIKRKHGGTGLGLVLSKRLAQLLGGDVVLSASKPGAGSTFTITIDPGVIGTVIFENFTPSSMVTQQTREGKSTSDMVLKGMTVLLVEDSPDNRLLVTRILERAGVAADTAENGREALELMGKKGYDAVLMDLQMPIMDGFEAIGHLRRSGDETPVIALTAHALKEEQLRCFAAGFNDHLSKPINYQALLRSLAVQTGRLPTELN